MNDLFVLDENGVAQNSHITYPFPYTMAEVQMDSYCVPWHQHAEIEFNYAAKGTILLETVNRLYTVHEGEAYFINTNVLNMKRKADDCASALECAHLFHPVLLAGHYGSVFEVKYIDPVLHDLSLDAMVITEKTQSGKLFLKTLHELTQISRQSDSEFQVRNLLSQAWLALLQEISLQKHTRQRPSSYAHERAKDILSYIHENYAEKITIAEIAAHVNVSPRECIRAFKTTFHQTPMEFLLHYRLEQAKRLLRETQAPITEIAFQTGFQNNAYFSKTFKRYLDVTPKEYRAQSRS